MMRNTDQEWNVLILMCELKQTTPSCQVKGSNRFSLSKLDNLFERYKRFSSSEFLK